MEVNSSLQFWKVEGPTFDEGDSSLGEPSPVLNPESVSIVSNLQVSIISILDFLSDLSFKTFKMRYVLQ